MEPGQEPGQHETFKKGMRLMEMAARDPKIGEMLHGDAKQQKEALAKVNLKREHVAEAAQRIAQEFAAEEVEANFW